MTRSLLGWLRRPSLTPQQLAWRQRGQRDADATRRLLERVLRKDSNCVDIGAHSGEVLDHFLSLAPEGSHLAIEPLPQLASRLRKKYPRVRIEECALAEAAGKATFFHVVERPAWSGLSRQTLPRDSPVEEITVAVKPLDDVILGRTDLIKIDVEGAELGVLRGARGVLRDQRPYLLFEHAITHAEGYSTSPEDVWDVLAEAGYAVSSLSGHGPHTRAEFASVCARSHASGYDADAETNWLAVPDSSG